MLPTQTDKFPIADLDYSLDSMVAIILQASRLEFNCPQFILNN